LLLIKALALADQLDCPDKKLVKNIELKLLGLSRSLPILIENLENDEKVRHAAFTLGMKHHRYDVANIGFEHLIALYSHKMPQEVGRLHHEMSLGFKHLNNSARQSWVFLELFGEFSKQMRQFEYALQAFDRAIELLPRIKRQPLATQSRIASLLLRSAGCSLDLGWRNGARHRVEQVLALIVAHSQIFPVAENTIGTLRYALKIIDNSRDHSSSLSLLRDAGLFFEETAMLPSWRMKRNNPYYKAQSDKEDWMICAF
jgi:tetratricopeptide (TPR) repeat protein